MRISFPVMAQKKQAQIAIDENLFQKYWTMEDQYEEIIASPNKDIVMIIAFRGKEAIGTCTYNKLKLMVAVFVKEEYRGKNIGSMLLNKLLKRFKLNRNEVLAGLGIDGSSCFFKKNGILAYEYAETPFNYRKTPSTLTKEDAEKDFLRNEHALIFGKVKMEEDVNVDFPEMPQEVMAEVALNNHLYVDGWCMFKDLKYIQNYPDTNMIMTLAYVKNEAVGACLYHREEKRIGVFVNPEFRNKNIGSNLLNHTISKFCLNKNEVFAGWGNTESIDFFKKNEILAYQYGYVPVIKTVGDLVDEEFSFNTQNIPLMRFLKNHHEETFSKLEVA